VAQTQRFALLSTDDKGDLREIATYLQQASLTILASGGTARTITEQTGIVPIDVSEWTGFPAILNHRLVTIHSRVAAGMLALPGNEEHMLDMADAGWELIEFVYFGLYDFEQRLTKSDGSWEYLVENMDVGGPMALCAAAKGARYVVTNPKQALHVAAMLAQGVTPTEWALRDMQRNAVAAAVAHYQLVLEAMDDFLEPEESARQFAELS
jgi:AICAR transformylase/IMP cyclohydrolase PurH